MEQSGLIVNRNQHHTSCPIVSMLSGKELFSLSINDPRPSLVSMVSTLLRAQSTSVYAVALKKHMNVPERSLLKLLCPYDALDDTLQIGRLHLLICCQWCHGTSIFHQPSHQNCVFLDSNNSPIVRISWGCLGDITAYFAYFNIAISRYWTQNVPLGAPQARPII